MLTITAQVKLIVDTTYCVLRICYFNFEPEIHLVINKSFINSADLLLYIN